jgi:hypothetical protein
MSYLENIYTSSHTSICATDVSHFFNNKALLINTSFNNKPDILGLRSEKSIAHLCLKQEDVETSHHALHAGHQELLYLTLHIQDLASLP